MSRRPARRADPRPERGLAGEAAATRHLKRLGYRLEATRLRTRLGEIDLLVRRRRLWVAVEVKTRRHHPAPERTVGTEQLARVTRALVALAPTLRPRPRRLRVDVVAVRWDPSGSPEVRHFAGDPFPPADQESGE